MNHLHDSSIAFALGGLAGNNAHGAGFLQAALDEGVKPRMISCTSGQIRWAYEFLRDPAERGGDLRTLQAEAIQRAGPTGNKTLDSMFRMVFGIPGVMKIDWAGYLGDWAENAAATLHRFLRARGDVVPYQEVLRTWPCRYFEPTPEPGLFERISTLFNGCHDVGIVFNSFNPVEGVENVYLNDAAREMLSGRKRGSKYAPGSRSSYRERTVYQAITPDAVRDGLWLYNYGFDPEDRPRAHELFLDGACFRDVLLSELTPVRHIYAVRPVNYRWMGALPTNYADLEDLKTKVAFNGAYDGERHQIFLINKLCREEAFADRDGDREPYHHVELEELEIALPRGYLDYAFEDMAVFENAYRRARTMLSGPPPDGSGNGRGARAVALQPARA